MITDGSPSHCVRRRFRHMAPRRHPIRNRTHNPRHRTRRISPLPRAGTYPLAANRAAPCAITHRIAPIATVLNCPRLRLPRTARRIGTAWRIPASPPRGQRRRPEGGAGRRRAQASRREAQPGGPNARGRRCSGASGSDPDRLCRAGPAENPRRGQSVGTASRMERALQVLHAAGIGRRGLSDAEDCEVGSVERKGGQSRCETVRTLGTAPGRSAELRPAAAGCAPAQRTRAPHPAHAERREVPRRPAAGEPFRAGAARLPRAPRPSVGMRAGTGTCRAAHADGRPRLEPAPEPRLLAVRAAASGRPSRSRGGLAAPCALAIQNRAGFTS